VKEEEENSVDCMSIKHYGMACPLLAVGGKCLQIWREATNIPNKQCRTAKKGSPPA
jgi:hypothetical protein